MVGGLGGGHVQEEVSGTGVRDLGFVEKCFVSWRTLVPCSSAVWKDGSSWCVRETSFWLHVAHLV
mgnify:CR=1 FL=1